MGVAVIGDLIFIIGGWNERGAVEEVEVMNTKTQTMETFTRIPTGRRGMGVGVVDDRFIWTFGGWIDGLKAVDVIEMCDIKTGEWKTLDVKITSPRVDSKAVVVNDKIWIIGGMSSTNEPVKDFEIIDKDNDLDNCSFIDHSSQISHCHWFLKNCLLKKKKKRV